MILHEILKRYSLEIDENVQRPFEWDDDCIRLFYEKNIIQEGLKFMESPDEYKPLSDTGTITIFKRTQGTSKDFYLDDGGHRVLAAIVMLAALNKIANEYNLLDKEESREICAFISGAVKNAKTNFIPHSSDVKEYKNILENSVSGKSKDSPHLSSAYYIAYNCFKNLYLEKTENFFKVCDFITGFFSFQICQYEWASMECRKTKYNEINNTKKEQNEIHRALSTLQEDASSLGVEGFIEKTLDAKKKISETFTQNSADKIIHNPYLKRYLLCKLLSTFGELFTTSKAVTQIDTAAKAIIIGGSEEKRINFYKTAYDDVDFFCNLWDGSLRLGMPASDKNNVHMLALALIERPLSARSQDHISVLTFRIIKSIFNINSAKIVGIKEQFDEQVAWHLIHMLCLFRLRQMIAKLNGTDTRNDLRPLLDWGDIISTNEQLIKYDEYFTKKIDELFENEAYKTTLFTYTYGSEEAKWLLTLVSIDENNFSESCYNIAINFLDTNHSQVDHIIHKNAEVFKNDTSALSKKHILGNLRLLPTTKNKRENNPQNERFINQQDTAFPENMRGRYFSIDDINDRQRWAADKIRENAERISSYC